MKYQPLTDFFEISGAKQLDKIQFETATVDNLEAVPFVGRSSTNNGIVDYVLPKSGYLNKGGVITIALDGSTGATFYQHHDFCSGQNIWVLKPIKNKIENFSPEIALFLVTTIRRSVEEYSYNLGLTKGRLEKINILIPTDENGKLDILSIQTIVRGLHNSSHISALSETRY